MVLPGYDDIELVENGAEIEVRLENLEEYVTSLLRFYLVETNLKQIVAFREGFSQVFPLENMRCFNSSEMEIIVCGERDFVWERSMLEENLKAAYGYFQTW